MPGATAYSGAVRASITLYSPDGWLRGGPEHDGDILALMRGLKRIGVHDGHLRRRPPDEIRLQHLWPAGAGDPGRAAADRVYDPAGLGPHDAFMLRRFPQPGDPPPCQRLNDGSRRLRGPRQPGHAVRALHVHLPRTHPGLLQTHGPLPVETQIQLHPEITGPSRAMLLGVMRALRREGVPLIQFDPASANALFFNYVGLAQLAALAQLPVQSSYAPQQLTASDAFLLRKPIAAGGPTPCGRFPDGTGLYVCAATRPRRRRATTCPRTPIPDQP